MLSPRPFFISCRVPHSFAFFAKGWARAVKSTFCALLKPAGEARRAH
jgi:hypothetical protein